MEAIHESKRLRVRRALDANDIFGGLPEADQDDLIGHGFTTTFAANETIFRSEDPGESMMVVLSGRVKISNVSAEGKEAILNFIDPGQVFGEIALLDGRPRTADATALEPTELFVLRRRELLPFLDARPRLAIKVIEMLCAKLRHTTHMVEDLMLLGMGARLARSLLRLAEEHGKRRGGAIRLDLKLSQRDLGSYIGLSREHVNRQLKVWRELGMVTIQEGYILILDEAALRVVADERE